MEFKNDITDSSNLTAAKIAELENMKENLKRAKDDAMQSWLDSRPLIGELEKMQSELANARARVMKANTVISEQQAQIGTAGMGIKSTKEEEEKFHIIINHKSQELHKKQETLQTPQLTYEAIQLEAEAFATSAAQVLRYINDSEAEWRTSVSLEEKLVAKNNRDSAFKR
ncbi:hypothetical protein BUALT_Bualt04G0116500 [Buddleja alternifolia]|uniref:Uncharacterized protein n=1 Tax=Buddleja alternifolia TaxID=168488 RepID=A0AAV6XVL7_9LAMI|nr:hypothetical protein BUALT_Bualt04G0116500 [Buddleja alternifolia]